MRAGDDRLELIADGPISLDVLYRLTAAETGSEIEASVSVEGRGLFARVLARATAALLAGGALRMSLERLARELPPVTGRA